MQLHNKYAALAAQPDTISGKNRSCLKSIFFAGVSVLMALQGHAQYTTYMAGIDHIYPSAATISKTDPNLQGKDGYALATTVMDAAMSMTMGEIIRTDAAGTQLWAMRYPGGGKSRFLSLQTYGFSGTTNYLAVGSINAGAGDQLLVACIDDNGSIIRSAQIPGASMPNLVGTRGIPTSDGGFAIVALASSGYDLTDGKQTVVIKMDSLLNVVYYNVYETSNIFYDHDSPTSIVEGATPDEFLIVGTANKDDPGIWYSSSCAMASLIDMPTGIVTWSHHFGTATGGHWDNGADAWYNPADSTFWVLANSSIRHYFNLTHLDRSGSVLSFSQYDSPGYADYDVYGFTLKPSLQTAGNFVVGSWKYGFTAGANYVAPMLTEVDPAMPAMVWTIRYTGASTAGLDINRMLSINENNWLRADGTGQQPFYYNSLMTCKPDGSGYMILTSDTLGTTVERPRMWRSDDQQGHVTCGSEVPNTEYNPTVDYVTYPPLQFIGQFGSTGSGALAMEIINYEEQKCTSGADGSVYKQTAAAAQQWRVFPNPANSYCTVESSKGLGSISVTDVCGRELIRLQGNGTQQMQIDISKWSPGVYLIRASDNAQQVHTQTIQVLH